MAEWSRIGAAALVQHHKAGLLDYAEEGSFERVSKSLGFNTVGVGAEKLLKEGWEAVVRKKEKLDAMGLHALVNASKEALFEPENNVLAKQVFEVAKHLNSDIVQAKMNGAFQRYQEPWSAAKTKERIDYMIEFGKRSSDLGAKYKVKVAVENHIDYRMEELVDIYERVSSPYFGMLYDTANQLFYGEDPIEFTRVLGRHVFSTHIKDAFGIEHPDGIQVRWCKPGTGAVDLAAVGMELARYNRDLPLVTEFFISDDSPIIPMKHDSYWKSLGLRKNAKRRGFGLLLEAGARQKGYHPICGDAALKYEIEASKQLIRDLPGLFRQAKQGRG